MTYVVAEPCVNCRYTDCAIPCPVEAFHLDDDMLVINPETCIDCDACVPECPVEAIKPDTEPGLEKLVSLNAEFAKVWPNITAKKPPPGDAKQWESVPNKLNDHFSPNPGGGD